MSKATEAVSLRILGKEYKIACPVDETESLIRTAHELDRQMRKIRDTGKVSGTERIAVLAALNLGNESGQSEDPVGNEKLCQHLAALRKKIETVLENP